MPTNKNGPLEEVKKLRDLTGEMQGLTIGEVVDTNDPQQMGRVRVACPILSEQGNDSIESIPWAMYMSPFAGSAVSPSRGRGDDTTPGEIAYGMFNIPKVGSKVIIAFIDNDPKFRVWMGCIYDQYLTHTMPHGRYSYRTVEKPDGPFSSTEDKIQPLYDAQSNAFKRSATTPIDPDTPTDTPRQNYEFRTRSADVSVGGLDKEFVENEDSFVSFFEDDFDFEFTEDDGNKIRSTQGYKKSRIEDDATSDNTNKNVLYDPQTYSWTTPGFHSISMSDSSDNCRMRFRTTHGHQIIMDDTNERIYISTAGGKCWIEMDEAGNVDVYAERNLSFHAEQDINFTTEKAFRVKAKDGIHMISETEMRLHAKTEMHIKSDLALNLHTNDDLNIYAALDVNIDTPNNVLLTSKQDIDILCGGALIVETTNEIDMKSGAAVIVEASADISSKAGGAFIGEAGGAASLLAGAKVLLTGTEVHLNGPPASPGASASGATGSDALEDVTFESFWTSRVPEHEPWARVMTDKDIGDLDTDNDHSPEYPYDDKNVGKKERGDPIVRNPKWHR